MENEQWISFYPLEIEGKVILVQPSRYVAYNEMKHIHQTLRNTFPRNIHVIVPHDLKVTAESKSDVISQLERLLDEIRKFEG